MAISTVVKISNGFEAPAPKRKVKLFPIILTLRFGAVLSIITTVGMTANDHKGIHPWKVNYEEASSKRRLLSPEMIQHIKRSVVAIGITEKGRLEPKEIVGTGFFVNKKGYVMTAAHVLRDLKRYERIYASKGVQVDFAVFHTDPEVLEFHFTTFPFIEALVVNLKDAGIGYVGPQDLDIGIIVPSIQHRNDLPHLSIKPSTFKPPLASEIAVVGYPKGIHTLNLTKREDGIRVSPVLQFGRITGFMLYDEAPQPYAVQTDVIGTGGSSGSPIIDISDGQVIGLAQEVIPTEVEARKLVVGDGEEPISNPQIYSGMAKIGLIFGVTNQILFGLPEKGRMQFEEKIPIKLSIQLTDLEKVTRTDATNQKE